MKNAFIFFLIIIIVVLAYMQFKPKENTLPDTTPVGQTTTNDNPNGVDYQPPTTNTPISTTLSPKYMGSQNWPPVVQSSTVAYSCTPDAGVGEVPTEVTEKIINGRTYCITNVTEAAMGQRFGDYIYTTADGSGTKTASFNLQWSSCGGYGGPGDAQYDECQSVVTNFFNNLDNTVDSFF